MSLELTSAFLLLAVACLCAAWLIQARARTVTLPTSTPDAEEWRSAALRHFHEHRNLETTVVQVLATSGAVSGQARTQLLVALGAPRVDTLL
jgi:hypothetical protein